MVNRLEAVIRHIGQAAAWLSLAVVLLSFTVVVLRYGFGLGWIWLQETVTYLHATVFMLAAAWTLQADAHVRVDIFYRRGSERQRAVTDLAGYLLLLIPLCVFLLVIGWHYVASSWSLLEGSREPGGLPFVYLLKSLILVLPAMLLLQALVGVRRSLAVLREGSPARAS